MSLKTKIIKAKIHLFFHRKRYVGSYPRVKKVVFVLFLLIVNTYVWNNVFNQYKVDPLVNISLASAPLVFENPKAFAAEVPTEIKEGSDKVPTEVKNEDLVSLIHKLESSYGRNNYSKCKEIGKYNEYGYGIPGNGDYLCFSRGEDRKAVENWIDDKTSKGYTRQQMLCLYNTGKATDSCEYISKLNI